MARLVRWFAIAITFMSGVAAARNVNELGTGETLLQQTVSFTVVLHGILGLLACYAILRRRSWAVTIAAAWAIVVCYTASVASFAFHDPSFKEEGTLFGVLGAGIATAVVGWLVIRAAQYSVQPPVASPEPHA